MSQARKKLVCFGGGTGLSSLLSGLRDNPFFDVTAIVTMFDNGGSSGELRDRFGVLPPGDIMKCMAALAQYPGVVREILNKRVHRSGRASHTAGNMLLFGIEKVYGDYYEAIKVFGELLSIHGSVIPVTTKTSTLYGELADGREIKEGEGIDAALLNEPVMLRRLFLRPNIRAFQPAIAAIKKADIFVVGPGSLYTSVLPNFLPEGTVQAIRSSKAPIIFVLNLLTEGPGMPRKMSVEHWVKTAEAYVGRRFTKIIINQARPTAAIKEAYEREGKYPLLYSKKIKDRRFIPADIWLDQNIARHDPAALTWAITKTAIQLLK